MSVIQAPIDLQYPESDGVPMGETDLHRDWIIRILDLLRYRYRGQRVYTAADLLVYYEEGSPARNIVPDDFVVKDCDPGRRRVFKIWEEGRAPDVVFEVTSRTTQREDVVRKPKLYAQIGIQEYFLYDPSGDYLDPPLMGFRLEAEQYSRIEPDEQGLLACQQLGVQLRLEDGELTMYDSVTGSRLQTESEAERAARQRAEAKAAAEAKARQVAEEELRRLREQLRERSGNS